MPVWIALVGAYLIGSLDFAVVVARAHGVDIHSVGSGNPGASNILRTLGRGPAAMVFLGDALKGVIAAAVGLLAARTNQLASTTGWELAAGLLAVVGHCFPVYHRFKGGKGVATGGGVLLYVEPVVFVLVVAVWVVIAKVFKVASVASLVSVLLVIPLVLWRGIGGWPLLPLTAMLLLIVARHTPNIRRMIAGAEQKVPA